MPRPIPLKPALSLEKKLYFLTASKLSLINYHLLNATENDHKRSQTTYINPTINRDYLSVSMAGILRGKQHYFDTRGVTVTLYVS